MSARVGVGPLDRAADRLVPAAEFLSTVRGWRSAAVALLLGALAAFALPPIHLVPLIALGFTGLLWMLDGRSARGAFATGWCFGFGYFVVSLYWMANALLLDGAFFWMIPFAVVGLSAVLALFPAVATALAQRFTARGVPRVVVFAVVWTAIEWTRGYVLTGFPWNLIGTVWAGSEAMMQLAAFGGVHGLGLFTVIVAALPITLADSGRTRWVGPVATVLLIALAWVVGAIRLPSEVADVPGVALRLVQPNVPQSLKWDPQEREANLRKTIAVTHAEGLASRTHVVWPETAVPFVVTDYNRDGPLLRAALATAAPPQGVLITGAPRAEVGARGERRFWNSLHALDSQGHIVATYDKHHLVPFGEYVPLRVLIDPLGVTPAGAVDFSAGPGPTTLAIPGVPPASPLICYEAIFPAGVVAESRPEWLLNITNDAWFGYSFGPYQHFAAARFRAVEQGLPLVRAANNGISAVVDPFGRVRARLDLGATGVLDSKLPQSITPTSYARWGDWVPAILCVILLAAAIGVRRYSAASG